MINTALVSVWTSQQVMTTEHRLYYEMLIRIDFNCDFFCDLRHYITDRLQLSSNNRVI